MIYLAPPRSNDENMIGASDLTPQAGGAFAAGPHYTPHVTPLAGLRAALGAGAEITYAKGCEVLGDDAARALRRQLRRRATPRWPCWCWRARAACIGRRPWARPNDATNLDLTGVQGELVEAVAATGNHALMSAFNRS